MTGELRADHSTLLLQIYTSSPSLNLSAFVNNVWPPGTLHFFWSCSHMGLTKRSRLAGRVRVASRSFIVRLAASNQRLTLSYLLPYSKLKPLKAPKKGKAEEDEDDAAVSSAPDVLLHCSR